MLSVWNPQKLSGKPMWNPQKLSGKPMWGLYGGSVAQTRLDLIGNEESPHGRAYRFGINSAVFS
jgi:hypothetical protein